MSHSPVLQNSTSDKLCYEWHNQRRRALLLLYPKIKVFLKQGKNRYNPTKILVVTITFQVFLTALIANASTNYDPGLAFGLCILLASTLGAWLMFWSQALIHHCSHRTPIKSFAYCAALVADMLYCESGPCFALYFFRYHMQHHIAVGSKSDTCIPVHYHWSVVPKPLTRSALGRWLWLCIVGLFTTELLIVQNFLLKYNFIKSDSLLEAYQQNGAEFYLTAIFKIAFSLVIFTTLGWLPYLYLRLSAGFAFGAFAHPFVSFWLIQHAAVESSNYQATLSYAGNRWWQRVSAWEFLHVEHHDFPTASPQDLVQIRQLCRREYECLHEVTSIRKVIWSWLTLTDGRAWSDFAAHQYCSNNGITGKRT